MTSDQKGLKPNTVAGLKLMVCCYPLFKLLPKDRGYTTGPEEMNQTFLLSFTEGTQVTLFHSYFLEKGIRSKSSM